MPAPSDMVSDYMSLDQAMGDLGATFAQAKDALAKSTSTLGAVFKEVLPQSEVPATAEGFADVLGSGTSTMASFARALTVRGSESTLKLILGHGIEGDFEAALSEFPRRSNGKLVSLKPFSEPASRLANICMNTMERRATETATRASRARSEPVSEK